MRSGKIIGIFGRSTATVIFVLMASGALFFGWQRIARSQAADHDNKADNRNRAATIRADKQTSPSLNLADGYDLGTPSGQFAGEQPTHLASADLDSDGVPDLLTADMSGKIRFYKGNNIIRNKGLDPFELTGETFQLGFAPDFFETGDLNADGNKDVLAAAKGGNVLDLLAGNGRGHLVARRSIPVDGSITAVATGEIGQADGQTDVAVAVTNQNGAFLLVFEHPEGAFSHPPEIIKLPGAATELAIGDLDGDLFSDIVVASGTTLTVVHERGQTYPWDMVESAGVKRPPAIAETREMPFGIAGIAIGEFGDRRGNSLAILSGDGSICLLEPVKLKPARQAAALPVGSTVRPTFLPHDVDPSGLSVMRQRPIDPETARTYGAIKMDQSMSAVDRHNLAQQRVKDAAAEFSKLSRQERELTNARQKAVAALKRERGKASFMRAISAKPLPILQWDLHMMTEGVGAVSSASAKTLITARVSTSGNDDLIVLDPVGQQIQVVSRQTRSEAQRARNRVPTTDHEPLATSVTSLGVDAGPAAVLPMRLNADALSDLVVLRSGASVPSIVLTAPTSVITVNDASDNGGSCAVGQPCTLRSAINAANGSPGSTIAFNILGGGLQTISPVSELPVVRSPMTIDATTQPGYSGSPLIEIKGNNFSSGQSVDGLKIRASNCVVRALAINEFPGVSDGNSTIGGNGLTSESTSQSPNNGHNIFEGNYLGTDPTGTLDKGNQGTGLLVFDSSNNTIGGTTAAARNVLSGNGTPALHGAGLDVTGGSNNIVQGNYIGVSASGNQVLNNGEGIFLTGSSNQIGGDDAGAGNVISGNGEGSRLIDPDSHCHGPGLDEEILTGDDGVTNLTLNNIVKGNKIGTNAAGTLGIGNCTQGVITNTLTQMTIGSITEGGRNVISDNRFGAISISGFANFTNNGADYMGGFTNVVGNNIGTDVTGTVGLSNNGQNGCNTAFCLPYGDVTAYPGDEAFIAIGSPGGTTPGADCTGFCNLISGDFVGLLHGTNSVGVDGAIQRNFGGSVGIFNNYVGTDRSGTVSLPNQFGISKDVPFFDLGIPPGPTYIGFAAASTPGGQIDTSLGNLISGNWYDAIDWSNWGSGSFCQANLIGTDATGNSPIPNSPHYVGSGDTAVYLFSAGPDTFYFGGPDPLQRNVVSGNGNYGVQVTGNVLFNNNYIGLNKDGTAPLPNQSVGIYMYPYYGVTAIGGTGPGAANRIENNVGDGIAISGGNSGSYCDIQGNSISNNGAAGVHFVSRAFFNNNSNNDRIGGNTIANNAGAGVVVEGGVGNTIVGNSIHGNGSLGIDLGADGVTPNDCGDADLGPNDLQNYPVLAAPVFNGDGTVSISGTLKAEPFQSNRIDFYSNTEADPTGYGEGETYIGSVNVVTDGNGFTNIAATSPAPVPSGSLITGTTTNQNGSTSEFSCVAGQCVGSIPEDRDSPSAGCPLPMVVNVTTDDHDADTTDGVCDTDVNTPGFQCSLRAVIEQANDAHALTRSISFNIPGAGVQTITPASALPTITMPVQLYGSSQGGQPGSHLIEINGSNAGAGAVDGLILGSGSNGSTIEGLVITHFHGGYGIGIQGSSSNAVKTCYLGLDPGGLTFDDDPATVQLGGIDVESGAASNTIGGPAAESNVITGNTKGIFLGPGGSNKIINNKIGVDKNGNQPSQGTGAGFGIVISSSNANVIGGDFGILGNLISNSVLDGISISGSQGTIIKGNSIGTDATGQIAVPNRRSGINVGAGSSGTVIGGANAADRNVISGNNFDQSDAGVVVSGDAAAGNQILGNYVGLGPTAGNPVPNSQGILIFSSGTVIGSAQAPNIISGNTGPGVNVVGSSPTLSGTSIVNNLIGINANSERFRNGVGVLMSGDVQNTNIRDNTISGNVDGVGVALLLGPGNSISPSNNTIFHNRIGVDRNGTTAVANTIGISISESSSNSVIGNVISGNSTFGISLGNNSSNNTLPTSQNVVQGNLIGTNADGTAAIANMLGGVGLIDNAQNNLIGGSIAANQSNVISGNTSATDSNVGYGVFIGSLLAGSDPTHYPTLNRIQGNHVGLNRTDDTGIPNTWGVYLDHALINTIGGDSQDLANVIGENLHDGVYIIGSETTGNVLNNNYIGVSSGGNFVTPNQGDGISVLEGAVDTTIKNNVVSGNLGNGIEVADLAPSNTQKPGIRGPQDLSGSISIVGNLVGAVQPVAGGGTQPAGNGLSGIMLECVQQAQIGDPNNLNAISNIISGNQATGITILQNLGNRPQRPRRPGAPTDCISDGNTIINAIIGTDATGTPGLGNASNGIQVSDSNNVVIGKAGAGNVIAGNQGNGISLQGGSSNSIAGNNVGVVPVGTAFVKVPNEQNGIDVAGSTNNQIGGADTGAGNTVAANTGEGILIDQLSANLTVRHNLIGTVLNNLSQRPNGKIRTPSDETFGNGRNGVLIENGSHNIEIGDPGPGDGNDIEFNLLSGVDLDATAGTGNLIDPNSIAGNSQLGIDLGGSGMSLANDPGDADAGPNNLQNYPEFSSAIIGPNGDLIVRFKVDSDPTNSNYGSDGIYVEFFKGDGSLQGQTFLGSTHYTVDNYVAGSPGIISFNAGNAVALNIQTGDKIVATATDADGNTSEFTGTNVGVVVAPTAATVQISGRVLTSEGSGVRGAIVTVTDPKGIARSVLTNAFGYYAFDGVRSGESYVVRATARLHTFGPRLVNITDSLTDLDFVDGR